MYRKRIKDCDGQYVAIYGKTPEELTSKLQIAMQEIEEAVSRKNCPTHLVLSEMNIKKIQYLAGHENIKMTMDVYTHLLNNRPEDLIGEISNVFAQNN